MRPAPSSDFVSIDRWTVARAIAVGRDHRRVADGCVAGRSARPVPHGEGSRGRTRHDPLPTRSAGGATGRDVAPPHRAAGTAARRDGPASAAGSAAPHGGARRPSANTRRHRPAFGRDSRTGALGRASIAAARRHRWRRSARPPLDERRADRQTARRARRGTARRSREASDQGRPAAGAAAIPRPVCRGAACWPRSSSCSSCSPRCSCGSASCRRPRLPISATPVPASGRDRRVDRRPRGAIFDRHGDEIAMSVPARTVTVNPQQVEDEVGTARVLAGILGLPTRRSRTNSSTCCTTRRRGFAYVARQVDPTYADQIDGLGLVGVYTQP